MKNNNRVQLAGIAGIGGAVLWIVTIVLEYSLGLEPPGSGPLFVVNQVLAFIALAATSLAFVGLLWGGALKGWLGKLAVGLYALAYALIIIAGILALFIGNEDSPIFLLFPIGGLMSTLGVVLTGIAVAVQGHWSGWRRFMPLIHALYVFFAIDLPFFLSNTPEGPGMVREIIWGVSLFFVGLAVYTAQRPVDRVQASAVA
jgi:hypothetical protein